MIVTFRRRQLPTPAAACRWLFGYPYFIGSINYGIGATILLYESWINHPSNLSDPYTQARPPSPPLPSTPYCRLRLPTVAGSSCYMTLQYPPVTCTRGDYLA